MRLGEILKSQGKLSEQDVELALSSQARSGGLFGQVLARLGLASQQDVNQALTRLKACVVAPAIAISMSACQGSWGQYNYGPADWLTENGYGTWDTMYSYERFVEPDIRVHRVENLSVYCGNQYARGCARLTGLTCDIWIGRNPPVGVLEHEVRHCHGWDHYEPDYRHWALFDNSRKSRELARAGYWHPMQQFANLGTKESEQVAAYNKVSSID